MHVQAREILHEHFDLFKELLSEYNISVSREIGDGSGRSRRRMTGFTDLMPSMRIAVDLRAELFRDANTKWKPSAIHDIDALSMAVPYYHLVVPDRQMAHLLSRSRAGLRCGTQIVPRLGELPGYLADLTDRARSASAVGSGWAETDDGEEFCTDLADLVRGLTA